MFKFLLLVVSFFLIVAYLRHAGKRRSSRSPSPAERAPEHMVKCAYCGVNQPVSESILTHGKYYCCNAHRQQAAARDA